MNLREVAVTVAEFLDDKVMKVRKAAMETLAVICSQGKHREIFLAALHEVLDARVYDELLDKVSEPPRVTTYPLGNSLRQVDSTSRMRMARWRCRRFQSTSSIRSEISTRRDLIDISDC